MQGGPDPDLKPQLSCTWPIAFLLLPWRRWVPFVIQQPKQPNPFLPQLQAALDPSASAPHPSSKGQVIAPSGAHIVTDTAGGPEGQGCMRCNSR